MKITEDEILKDLLPRPLTISMGIITRSNEKNVEELFVKVDKNLYKAKQEGRNKIVY